MVATLAPLSAPAGPLNGVFGEGENRHIVQAGGQLSMRQRLVAEDGDARPVHHRERWTNELCLVYVDGRVLKLTETPAKKEGEGDGECTPSTRAA